MSNLNVVGVEIVLKALQHYGSSFRVECYVEEYGFLGDSILQFGLSVPIGLGGSHVKRLQRTDISCRDFLL